MDEMDEGPRWFSIEVNRRRDMHKRADYARKRAAQSATREEKLQRAFSKSTTPNIHMRVTEWEVDEHGNLSRKIYNAE